MKNLPIIYNQEIGKDTIQAINARDLHRELDVKTDFSDWIKKRIKDYGFVENQDYLTAPEEKGADKTITYGQGRIEYIISLDMAKELAMVQRNDKGREARRYFIECEKKLRAKDKKQASLDWQVARKSAAIEYKIMSATLQEVRKLEGKDTKHFHYANEAKLVSFAMTKEFKGINREELTEDELRVLVLLETRNAVLIGAGIDRETRKASLVDLYNELTINRLGN